MAQINPINLLLIQYHYNLFFVKLNTFLTIFTERENCHGDEDLQDGQCPDFKCVDQSSCSGNGNCNGDNTSCICNAGFTGSDCFIDLNGEKSYDMKSRIYILYFLNPSEFLLKGG